jgi:hypothetical protein
MLKAAKCLLLVAVLFVSADVFAATTGPSFTAKLKLGKGGAVAGSSMTIKGKGIDLYTLWNLSTKDSAKASITMTEPFAAFTSNGNAKVTFFSAVDSKGNLTSNLNISYTVKVSKQGVATAQNDKTTAKTTKFKAVQGATSKSSFQIVISGATFEAAVALLPTGGKKNLPVLPALVNDAKKDFTVQIGSATFVANTQAKNQLQDQLK